MDARSAQQFRKSHPMFGFLADSEIQDVEGSNIGGLTKALVEKNPSHAAVLREGLLKALANALPKTPSVVEMMSNPENAPQGMTLGSMLLHRGVPVSVLDVDPGAQIVTIRLPSGHVARVPGVEFTSTAVSQEMTPKTWSGGSLNKSASTGFVVGQSVIWKCPRSSAPATRCVMVEPGAIESLIEHPTHYGSARAIVPTAELAAA